MNVEIIYTIQMIIVGLLVYVFNSSFGGYLEATIAKWVGDLVPEELGYRTVDPGAHFSFFWFTLMLAGLVFGYKVEFFAGFPGLSKNVPIAPGALVGKNRNLRIAIDFFARSIAQFMLLLVVVFCIIAPLFKMMASPYFISEWQSLIVALRMLATTFFTQGILIFSIYTTFGICRSILFFYFPNVNLFSFESILLTFVIWFFVAAFITPQLTQFLFGLLLKTGIINANALRAIIL